MKILSINCGSATLKFDVLDVDPSSEGTLSRVARGTVDRIDSNAVASLSVGAKRLERTDPARDHDEAFHAAVGLLEEAGVLSGIEAIGHRVVHGGTRFREPVVIDQAVIAAIDSASGLAPLHNRPAVAVIKTAQSHFGDRVRMVATFDTAFYAPLPDVATRYALPTELSERLDIRRFGFHGLAHRYMVERYSALRPGVREARLITLQLGNGCSATASVDGRPIDTSMGLTPLEGLIMGTRSGDVDPSIPLMLVEREELSPTEVSALLNERSGLLGISGRSNDMRELVAAARAGHPGSDLAVRAFCYSVKKYLGAYLCVLGGADAIIFGGGIGEHISEIREAICLGVQWAGLELDPQKNRAASGSDERISTDRSAIDAWVVRVDEAAIIARDAIDCLRRRVS